MATGQALAWRRWGLAAVLERQENAMTGHVVYSAVTERIAMTAPVLSGPGGFAFVLPAHPPRRDGVRRPCGPEESGS